MLSLDLFFIFSPFDQVDCLKHLCEPHNGSQGLSHMVNKWNLLWVENHNLQCIYIFGLYKSQESGMMICLEHALNYSSIKSACSKSTSHPIWPPLKCIPNMKYILLSPNLFPHGNYNISILILYVSRGIVFLSPNYMRQHMYVSCQE